MNGFVDLHGESITGEINTFDRVIFKGHLNGFFPDCIFRRKRPGVSGSSTFPVHTDGVWESNDYIQGTFPFVT